MKHMTINMDTIPITFVMKFDIDCFLIIVK